MIGKRRPRRFAWRRGAFVLVKAQDGPQIAAECLGHLRRYLEMLFRQPQAAE
ncbi:MAG: hypothetical protein M0Z28_12625 [Rhodospirillales bacterium]|nr:hypothetical protein [Rhodospirillales bacterium]